MDDKTVVVRDLVKDFPGVRAIDHLSFDVAPGEIFGICRPGRRGQDHDDANPSRRCLRRMAAARRSRNATSSRTSKSVKHLISYMPQRFGLYEDLTVAENIRFYADLFGVRRRDRESPAPPTCWKSCGMSEFRGRQAGKLSGGMKQKLGLVCAS